MLTKGEKGKANKIGNSKEEQSKSKANTNFFNVFPLKVALKLWVVNHFFSRQLLLNASNAQQAPLNGNTKPSHATANQPKQSGRWAGQKSEACHLYLSTNSAW